MSVEMGYGSYKCRVCFRESHQCKCISVNSCKKYPCRCWPGPIATCENFIKDRLLQSHSTTRYAPVNQGWQCPVCKNVYAPFIQACTKCNKVEYKAS